MKPNTAISAGCWYCPAARKEDAMTNNCVFSLLNSYLIDRVLAEIIFRQHLHLREQRAKRSCLHEHLATAATTQEIYFLSLWRDFMQRKKTGSRKTPIRYIVERVYSGTEDMERLLTSVSEEAARRNVEEKLKNRKTA